MFKNLCLIPERSLFVLNLVLPTLDDVVGNGYAKSRKYSKNIVLNQSEVRPKSNAKEIML